MTITRIEKSNTNEEIFNYLNPIVRTWFKEKFGTFSNPQKYSMIPIRDRRNILISSPTGSGKTLCVFGSILNYLIELDERKELEDKVYAVYISPLKALAGDIEINLKKPLEDMEKIAGRRFGIRVSIRTGDTTASERQKMAKHAPHILVTTPESFAILLTSPKFVEKLKQIEFVIIDEIHAIASGKRGVHLNLSLEILEQISSIKPVRIGLSATVAPLDEVARYLVGYEKTAKGFKERDCLVVDVQFLKELDLKVLSPLKDMINTTAKETQRRLYDLLDKLIEGHKTTLVFTNTRSATEKVVNHLKEMFPEKYEKLHEIGAHHSSLSKEHRFNIEKRLREGKLKAVVCSTSLELGIDIGYIDLVILLGSPKSVARALQRTGRAGHKLHDISEGRLIVIDRDDLIECAVLLKEGIEKKIDKIQIPRNCLDVLAQQIFGMTIMQRWKMTDLIETIKRSYCYNTLSKEDFFSVLSYLTGDYAGLEDQNVYAKIWYDESAGEMGKRGKLARVIYMTNVGTIPEESFVSVVAAMPRERKDEQIGKIDESFLERLKKGDVFVLGGQKYQFLYSKGMKAYVNASVSQAPTIPSWSSEMLPLSFDLAMAIQRFRRLICEMLDRKRTEKEVKDFIEKYLYIDKNGVDAIYNYFYEQYAYTKKKIPHEYRFLIERYKDESEKHYVIFHSLYGRRVNDALSRALAYVLAKNRKKDVEIGINDNGFFIASNYPLQAEKALALLVEKPEAMKEILNEAVDKTEVFKRRFRHCATRSLMILRSYKGLSKSVGKQQVKSDFLLNAVRKISTDFPILKETKREIMEDLMDIKNAEQVLRWMKEEKVKIESIVSDVPSPFSFNLITQGHADLMRMEDKIEFLKRMHEKILERIK